MFVSVIIWIIALSNALVSVDSRFYFLSASLLSVFHYYPHYSRFHNDRPRPPTLMSYLALSGAKQVSGE